MAMYSGFAHWKWWFSIVMLVYQRVPFGIIWGWFWYQITRGPSLQRCPAFGQGMRRWCRWFPSFWLHGGNGLISCWVPHSSRMDLKMFKTNIWCNLKHSFQGLLCCMGRFYFNQCVEWNSKSSLLDRPLLKQVMGGTPKSPELWMIILRLKPKVTSGSLMVWKHHKPSGKLTGANIAMENHNFQWLNPL